jgi:hypothetical protein
MSEKDKVLKTVKGYNSGSLNFYLCAREEAFYSLLIKNLQLFFFRILNKLTPEKFDSLKEQLLNSGITTADILQVSLILSGYF